MKILYKLAIVLVVVSLTSCTISARFHLFNNSNLPVTVVIGDKKVLIKPGKSKEFSGIEHNTFSITGKGIHYQYAVKKLPTDNIVWKGWGPFTKRVFYAQFNNGGKIWAIDKGQECPVKSYPKQPKGFPLTTKNGIKK